jgi:hypothetical protein
LEINHRNKMPQEYGIENSIQYVISDEVLKIKTSYF